MPATVKGAVVEIELMTSGPVPELVTQIVAAVLVVPTVGAPRPWVAELKESAELPVEVAFPWPNSQVSFE